MMYHIFIAYETPHQPFIPTFPEASTNLVSVYDKLIRRHNNIDAVYSILVIINISFCLYSLTGHLIVNCCRKYLLKLACFSH